MLKLEVDEINISQGLLEANLLDPLKAEDPHAIAKALEQFIDQIFCVTA